MISHRFVFIRSALFLAVVLIWNPTLSLAQATVQNNEQDKVMRSMEYNDVTTKSALKVLMKQLKLDVEFDESVTNSVLTLSRKEITIREFIDIALEEKKLAAKMKGEKTVLIFADTPENKSKFEALQTWSKTPAK